MPDTALNPLQVLNYLILIMVLKDWIYYLCFICICLSGPEKDLTAPRAYYGNKTLVVTQNFSINESVLDLYSMSI